MRKVDSRRHGNRVIVFGRHATQLLCPPPERERPRIGIEFLWRMLARSSDVCYPSLGLETLIARRSVPRLATTVGRIADQIQNSGEHSKLQVVHIRQSC
jgi:hypothetical protein